MKNPVPKPIIPISRKAREELKLGEEWFNSQGYLVIKSPAHARKLAHIFSQSYSNEHLLPSDIYGAGFICAAWQMLLDHYSKSPDSYKLTASSHIAVARGQEVLDSILSHFAQDFPSPKSRQECFQKWIITHLSQSDPAFTPFFKLFEYPLEIAGSTESWQAIEALDGNLSPRAPENKPPLTTLKRPIAVAPNSVKKQLLYILTHWGDILGDWAKYLLGALDMIEEETRPRFLGPGSAHGPGFGDLDETARFSPDENWMPKVVLIAKNTLVWLNQLSKSYGRNITRLDEIPNEELNTMASRGFNALWLIGLWKRSPASREIKQRMGNPEAAASAYSLFGYDIADELGGWDALQNLRHRAECRGIRLSSDMVPNHVGIDSDWVRNRPHWLLSSPHCPYPGYSFFSENLSGDGAVDIRLEDHYYSKSDAAVVFQRRDTRTGEFQYIYHGNDGTSMPWNDTAQINFLNPEAREAVIQDILHVARSFPIIRFDAAMVLARKHIRRLWFPAPGSGGAIPSRSEQALSDEEFAAALPHEFWREVVDRVSAETPGTLLLAEAFWMMEGYFVRTLGMHRVYNSAFMNMLRDQKNQEYRAIIKETLAFDPGILQRFVNFMNNPDEETAVNQFGKDDRYFAVCTLLATLPGLPMIGHGQIEGLGEKYGMEFVKAYREEQPDSDLIARHEREIFPLLNRRYLFAGAEAFRLYDVNGPYGTAESVYAFSNAAGDERALIVVNNAYERAEGTIKHAAPVSGDMLHNNLAAALIPAQSSNEDWLLLRDQTANLWFIRSVGDIRDKGLQISINGFGRHTFLDIHVQPEAEDGVWGILAMELGGAGVENLDAAIKEIRLRPVRKALAELIPEEVLYSLADSIRRGKKPVLDKNKAEEALSRLTGNPAEAFNTIQKRLAASAKLWRLFSRGFRRSLGRKFGSPESDDALFLAVWSVLSAAAAGKWEDWDIGGWLRAYLKPETPQALFRNMETALNLPDWTHLASKPSQALTVLLAYDEVRRACGVNFWNGETWYNLEGWNAFARTAALAAAGQAISRWRLRRLLRHWARAAKRAEYRLERLLE
ncbi:MAG: hypothetical protein B0D92_04800 [Spirochaeta sp. LUC14_002_19_P3]|nr:MAG: hypothetical protein B0D92_04800 [Spirochaeta sp. LUC14_002_19_P3]